MRINILTAALVAITFSYPVFAMDMGDMKKEHGGGTFHSFHLETDYGAGEHGSVATWDLDGWIGGDENKLWFKNEGERADNNLEQAELWAMYSHNISTFWDAQAGIRYDFKPKGTAYLTLGFDGLAPYFFETEAHLFVSDEGDVTARLREENDFLLTQKLILQPYAEINLSAQDIEEQDIGAGLTDGEIGLQTRYEITRKFAPYIDVRYERKFGQTSSIAKENGEDNDDVIGSVGLRLMF
jgi:copper resistance protein B